MKNKTCKMCKFGGCWTHQNINVKVKEIAKRVKWVEVKKSYEFFYPEFGTRLLKKAFTKIVNAKYYKVDKQEFVEINVARDEDVCDPYSDWYNINTNKYALSFRKWKEVANLYVSKKTLESLRDCDIMAHFLWEITWYGDEEKTKKIAGGLQKSMKEVEKKYGKK